MARNNEHKFKLNNEEYHLTWIDKPRITKNGIKQKVLPVLREYIITENLAIQLVNNNGNVQVGLPTVSGAKISATVLNHLKGDKVIVFKKKRRKGYRKLNGHRQALTKIKINSINA